jgi:hypothetical protein
MIAAAARAATAEQVIAIHMSLTANVRIQPVTTQPIQTVLAEGIAARHLATSGPDNSRAHFILIAKPNQAAR